MSTLPCQHAYGHPFPDPPCCPGLRLSAGMLREPFTVGRTGCEPHQWFSQSCPNALCTCRRTQSWPNHCTPKLLPAPPQALCLLFSQTSPGAPVLGDHSKIWHQKRVPLATHPATRTPDFLHPWRAQAAPVSTASLSGHSTTCTGLTPFCQVQGYRLSSSLSQPSPLQPPWSLSCKARVLQRDKPSRCCLQLGQAQATQ